MTVSVASTLTLKMGVGSESTTVEVTAAAVQIDTQNTAVTTNLTDTFYQQRSDAAQRERDLLCRSGRAEQAR